MKYKIGIISDTHGKHTEIDIANINYDTVDILIHCGDCTRNGELSEVEDFMNWYSGLHCMNKIMIAGNHDFLFEDKELSKYVRSKYPTIHYLEDSWISVNGVFIWGSPSNPVFYNWAFNDPIDVRKEKWSKIPDFTHIVVTHTPPYGILDRVNNFRPNPYNNEPNVGCKALLERLKEIKPLINCFGHIHEGYGDETIENTRFINAACLDENYEFKHGFKIVEIEI